MENTNYQAPNGVNEKQVASLLDFLHSDDPQIMRDEFNEFFMGAIDMYMFQDEKIPKDQFRTMYFIQLFLNNLAKATK